MSCEYELNTDLNNVITDFCKLKEFYLREQVLRQKFEGMTKNLQEENKIVRDLEKSERRKLNVSREYTLQQQETISHLIEAKSENIKLSEHIKQLEANLSDMKRQLSEEKEKWKCEQEKLILTKCHKIEELKFSSEKRVMEAEREAEDIKAKYHAQYSEFAKKLENIQNEKSNEISMVVFEYEERLHKMEEKLNATESEIETIRDKAAAEVIFYQKKVLVLEQLHKSVILEKEKLPPSLQSSSVESYVPRSASRNKSFQYNVPSSTNQNQPSRAPSKSPLKKTTVHNSVQASSDKESFVPSLSDLAEPEHIDTSEGKPAECNTTKICAEPRSSSPVVLLVSADRIIRKNSVGTRSSVRPQLQFVTEPSDFEGVTEVPFKQGSNSPIRGMRTRLAGAKKRKLFSSHT